MRLTGRQNHKGCMIRGRGRQHERESGRGRSKDRLLRVSQLEGHADGDRDRDRRGKGREGDRDRATMRERKGRMGISLNDEYFDVKRDGILKALWGLHCVRAIFGNWRKEVEQIICMAEAINLVHLLLGRLQFQEKQWILKRGFNVQKNYKTSSTWRRVSQDWKETNVQKFDDIL
ncbi:hypothetical protein DVH24_007829 [Malus domestica]|uniref:Uncharacterized protein n=1 Tax=Malus domestica TaxID=3750 RepID=A0A498JU93_MALDO|nr:hypothetical protein DVH24_007829 [Malus domestica]